MLYLLEFVLALYLAHVARKILLRGTAGNLIAFGILLAALVASYPAFALAGGLAGWLTGNFVTRLTFGVVASVGVYGFLTYWLSRKAEANERARVKAFQARLSLPRWLDRTLTGTFLAGFLALVFVLMLLWVNLLAAASAPMREAVARRTLLLGALLLPEEPSVPSSRPPPTVQAGAAPTEALSPAALAPAALAPAALVPAALVPEDALALQSAFLHNLGRGIARGREFIAEKTGAKAVLEHIHALREIVNLEPAEKMWLIESTPSLKGLLYNPFVVAVMENGRVLDLIEQVGKGSPTALYRLGDEPDMIALLEDPAVRRAIAGIDLRDLRERVRKQRKLGLPVPVFWSLDTMAQTTELDAKLRRRAQREMPQGQETLSWPDGSPLALAWTHMAAEKPVALQVRIRTEAHVTFWLNGTSLELSREDDWRTLEFTTPVGNVSLVIMLDFRGSTAPRTCEVKLVSRQGGR